MIHDIIAQMVHSESFCIRNALPGSLPGGGDEVETH